MMGCQIVYPESNHEKTSCRGKKVRDTYKITGNHSSKISKLWNIKIDKGTVNDQRLRRQFTSTHLWFWIGPKRDHKPEIGCQWDKTWHLNKTHRLMVLCHVDILILNIVHALWDLSTCRFVMNKLHRTFSLSLKSNLYLKLFQDKMLK